MKTIIQFILCITLLFGCSAPGMHSSYEGSSKYKPINELYTASNNDILLKSSPYSIRKISKGIQINDTIYVYGIYDYKWYMVRVGKRKYFAGYNDLTDFKAVNKMYKEAVPATFYPSPTNTTKSTYSPTRTIQTGPRGGQYYINKNGNKTYIKRK